VTLSPDGLIWHTTGNPQWDGACWIVLDKECNPADDVHHATEASARAATSTTPGGKYIRRHTCTCNRPNYVGVQR